MTAQTKADRARGIVESVLLYGAKTNGIPDSIMEDCISLVATEPWVLTGRGWMPASAMVKDENRGLEVYDRMHPAA